MGGVKSNRARTRTGSGVRHSNVARRPGARASRMARSTPRATEPVTNNTPPEDRGRSTDRLTTGLQGYFPQVVGWFRDKEAAIFADFVERWPTLEDAQRAREKTLVDFFHAHSVRYAATLERRIREIREEQPLTKDQAVIGPARLLVQALVPQLRAVCQAITRFDDEIARLRGRLADYDLFRSLPGAGPVFAARLLAAFGEQRERFPTADALQRYKGRSLSASSGNQLQIVSLQRRGFLWGLEKRGNFRLRIDHHDRGAVVDHVLAVHHRRLLIGHA